MTFSVTLLLVIITAITSVLAFNNHEMWNKGLLYPALMKDNPKEYHRFISSGFLHADWMHLIFNMYVLYGFGQANELLFKYETGMPYMFPVMYILAIVASSLPSYFKNKDNYQYRALGASGAVSAVVFSCIYFRPWLGFQFFGIEKLEIPGIVAGIAYLVYSAWAAKRAQDNIGHDAHFYGAIFGFFFTLAIEPSHGANFIKQILNPVF